MLNIQRTSLWSDFVIRLVRPTSDGDIIVKNSDGSERKWPCFESSIKAQPGFIIPSVGCERRSIVHWDDIPEMQPGDQLELAVQTYMGESQVDKLDGTLRVYTIWEPSTSTMGCL